MTSMRARWLEAVALVFLVAIAGTAAFSATAEQNADHSSHELTLKPLRGLVAVPIFIGDSKPLNFVIDSGSEHTTINDAKLASTLNLHTRKAGVGTGMGGSRLQVQIAPDVAIRSSEGDLFRTDLAVHHLAGLLADDTGRDLQGLLGSELFERYVVEIDPGRGLVVLHEPDAFFYNGPGHVIPIEIDHRRPFVKARLTTVDGKRMKVRLMVDTGSENQLALILGGRRHVQVPQHHREATALGVGGEANVIVGPVAGLEIGTLSIGRTAASFFNRSSMPAAQTIRKFDGLVGNGILGRYRTILDYHHRQLVLEEL